MKVSDLVWRNRGYDKVATIEANGAVVKIYGVAWGNHLVAVKKDGNEVTMSIPAESLQGFLDVVSVLI